MARTKAAGRTSQPFVDTERAGPVPVAVVDIGSNSGRLLVLEVDANGAMQVLETVGAPLRLVHDLASGQQLSEATRARTADVLRGFQALARGAGARHVTTLATAAVREARNGEAFVAELRQATGLEIEIIDGAREAYLGFLGAVCGLPVTSGLVLEVGGGSLQLMRFEARQLQRTWSLPLGSLRLSDAFLQSDPPAAPEVQALTEHVRGALADADVPPLAEGEQLIASGGTVRNLAKVDLRSREAPYPIDRLHGYAVGAAEVERVVARLLSVPAADRVGIPGLNPERFDSIVGGGLCVQTVMAHVGARGLMVSGRGMREGAALSQLMQQPPCVATVQAAAIRQVCSRFATWDADRARFRRTLALELATLLDGDTADEYRAALADAAATLDIGRAMDYYGARRHTADILLEADLAGFSHREIALRSATVRLEGKRSANLKAYAPLLGPPDQAPLVRSAAILALADAVVRQAPPEAVAEQALPGLERKAQGNLRLRAPWLNAWALRDEVRHLEQVLGIRVKVAA